MDLNSGLLIDRPRVIEIPITPTIISAVERIAQKQKAYRGLKMTNRHGNSFLDADLIAGVEEAVQNDNEELQNEENEHNNNENEDVVEVDDVTETGDEENSDSNEEYDEIEQNDLSEILYEAVEHEDNGANQTDDDPDDLPDLIEPGDDDSVSDDSDDEEENVRRYPARE